MNVYDAMASDFDRRRSLPETVPGAFRDIILRAGLPPAPRILDLGAGAGRIGRTFVRAGDDYYGVDLSFGMLRTFAGSVPVQPSLIQPRLIQPRLVRPRLVRPRLVQADGARLPFRDATFDAVLLVQVLSGAKGWRPLLVDVMRVLRPAGALIVGRVVAPDDGVDARMKGRLAEILQERDIHPYRDKPRDQALAWLLQRMPDPTTLTVAAWTEARRPDAFLERHAAGARFAVLAEPVRRDAMRRLAAWAVETFGSLDTACPEDRRFDLTIHRFQQGTTP
jgi:SAM-dependent methyltransferase